MAGPAVALGGLFVGLAELVVPLIIKVLAVRFAWKVAVVALMAGVTYTAYSAINAIMGAIVLPALPSGASIGWYLVNGEKLALLIGWIVGVESLIALGVFARNNLRVLAGV